MKTCPTCDRSYPTGDLCPVDGTPLVASREDPLLGAVLKGTYRIDERIAAGGMGAIYRGVQLALGRAVAIKVLRPDLEGSAEMAKRFFREARLLSQVIHPNVVTLLDCGSTESGLLFMVLEYLSGAGLETVAARPNPLDRVARWMEQICAGVGAAHAQRLVHRDLKPRNVFLARQSDGAETVKVLDFGISKGLDGDNTQLTKTGHLVGTPGYIAPEQIAGDAPADERSDIYALGAILYALLAGRPPYVGPTTQSILKKQLEDPPDLDALAAQGQPPEVVQVVAKAMARNPAYRYQTAAELAQAIGDAARAAGLTSSGGTSASTMLRAPAAVRPSGPRRGLGKPVAIAVAVAAGVGVAAFAAARLSPVAAGESAGSLNAVRSPPEVAPPPAAAPTPPARLVRGVSDSEVLLGMSAVFSGPAKELGRAMQLGLEAAFQAANAQGGVHGRRVRLVALDDADEPERTRANARELVLTREVFALLGAVSGAAAGALTPLANEQRMLLFGSRDGGPAVRRDPPDRYVFNYRPGFDLETAALVRHFVEVRQLKPSQIAVFAQDDETGRAGFDGVVRALRRYDARAADRVPRFTYPRNTSEVRAAVEAALAKRGSLRAIVVVAAYRPAAQFIYQLRAKKHPALIACLSFVGGRPLADELAQLGPAAGDGVLVTHLVPPPGSEASGVRRYRDALRALAPQEVPTFGSLEGYVAGSLLLEGLRRAGPDLDTERLVEALESIRDLDLGIGTLLSFGPSRHDASAKIWATQLDARGEYRPAELE